MIDFCYARLLCNDDTSHVNAELFVCWLVTDVQSLLHPSGTSRVLASVVGSAEVSGANEAAAAAWCTYVRAESVNCRAEGHAELVQSH